MYENTSVSAKISTYRPQIGRNSAKKFGVFWTVPSCALICRSVVNEDHQFQKNRMNNGTMTTALAAPMIRRSTMNAASRSPNSASGCPLGLSAGGGGRQPGGAG